MNAGRAIAIATLVLVLGTATACSTANNSANSAATALAAASGAAKAAAGATIDGIPCQGTEQLTYHVHAHLAMFADNVGVPVPANITFSSVG